MRDILVGFVLESETKNGMNLLGSIWFHECRLVVFNFNRTLLTPTWIDQVETEFKGTHYVRIDWFLLLYFYI